MIRSLKNASSASPATRATGEDVKEYYFYLDSTPTHSYMRYLYKYPQTAFPYDRLVEQNRRRSRLEPEYELVHTGCFDEHRYFDVFVEYAKASPEDICIRIQAVNRGPDTANLRCCPRSGIATPGHGAPISDVRVFMQAGPVDDASVIETVHEYYGLRRLLLCDKRRRSSSPKNETNSGRLYDDEEGPRYFKDGFHRLCRERAKGGGQP